MKALLLLLSAYIPLCMAYHLPGIDQIVTLRTMPDLNLGTIGLITNQTGKTANGTRTIDALRSIGLRLTTIFVPEHGLDGTIGAEKQVSHGIDTATAIPIISLYQENGPRAIDPAHLAPLDTVMVDLQDCGMRHFTYISTLLLVLTAAAQHNKTVVVLDRPNPLGGIMEGPLVEPALISFISIAPIPLRHGMTMGELARYFNSYVLEKPARLYIVPVHNYRRTPLTKLPAHLSPNLKTMQSVYGYSFLGLLSEIGPFDVAVGTKHAFQCLLLPEGLGIPARRWIALSKKLELLGMKCFSHRYYHQYKKQWMHGLRLRITDIMRVSTMNVFFTVMDFFKKDNVSFLFKSFDKAAGSMHVRNYVEGVTTHGALTELLRNQVRNFYRQAQSIFLYKPYPQQLF